MRPAIHVNKLSKSYRLHEKDKRGGRTLGETITAMLGTPFRKVGQRFGQDTNGVDEKEPHDLHWALKDVSFDVRPGEVCAVIGPNGAGKSTLFKILSRITRPTSGYVEIRGRLGSLLEVGTGFHPELTGRENVFLNGAILGMPRREIARKYDEIVAFAEIDQFIDMPVKRYSSGMHLRLAFAVAAHMEPDILLLDEVMSVGDAEFQKKSQARIQYLTQLGITTLIISHSLTDLSSLASRCLYIRHGRLVCDGEIDAAILKYHEDTVQELRAAKKSKDTNGRASHAGDGGGTMLKESATTPAVEVSGPKIESLSRPSVSYSRRDVITGVSAANPIGSSRIVEGDDLHVTVQYEPAALADHVHFRISVWNALEQMLTCANTRFGERSYLSGTAVCVFPAIPLKPGNYTVRVAMVDPEAHRKDDHTTHAGSFSVAPRNGSARTASPANDNASSSDFIRLPFEWSSRSSRSPSGNGRSKSRISTESSLVPTNSVYRPDDVVDEPLILAINGDKPVQVSFDFPKDSELPVNITVTSQQTTNSSNHSEKTALVSSEATETPLPAGVRRDMALQEPNSVVSFLHYGVRISSGQEFYTQCKDVFGQRIFDFETESRDPFIVDAGSHFGMSALYFKHAHPRARVIAFEPDPSLFRLLQENMTRNGLADVTLVNAGLGAESGTLTFTADPITGNLWPSEKGEILVQMRPLSAFITRPVDFLKLSLSGHELAILEELVNSGKLASVREMVVVHQSNPEQEQDLGKVLELLAKHGFRYMIHDFDAQTCSASKPPFRMKSGTRWSCLIYARRIGNTASPAAPNNGMAP